MMLIENLQQHPIGFTVYHPTTQVSNASWTSKLFAVGWSMRGQPVLRLVSIWILAFGIHTAILFQLIFCSKELPVDSPDVTSGTATFRLTPKPTGNCIPLVDSLSTAEEKYAF